MIDYRELGLTAIKDRIINDKDFLSINSIFRNSNNPIDKSLLNSVYIFEGKDVITDHSSKNFLGYPARRMLEVEIELITNADRDGKGIKSFYQNLRKTILCEKNEDVYTPNPILAENTVVRELRSFGPALYKVPELIGMKMVLGLYYIDNLE